MGRRVQRRGRVSDLILLMFSILEGVNNRRRTPVTVERVANSSRSSRCVHGSSLARETVSLPIRSVIVPFRCAVETAFLKFSPSQLRCVKDMQSLEPSAVFASACPTRFHTFFSSSTPQPRETHHYQLAQPEKKNNKPHHHMYSTPTPKGIPPYRARQRVGPSLYGAAWYALHGPTSTPIADSQPPSPRPASRPHRAWPRYPVTPLHVRLHHVTRHPATSPIPSPNPVPTHK